MFRPPFRLAALVATVIAVAAAFSGPAGAAPRVVATIVPVHSLSAAVMEGVGAPELLLPGVQSPHSYAMRPSDARKLENADVVVWAGEGVETFMIGPLAALAGKARVVELAATPDLELLRGRTGGVWEPEGHDHGHKHKHASGEKHGAADKHGDEDDHAHEFDHHVWLSTANAKLIVAHLARVLGEVDPANAARYAANARRADADIDALTGELRSRLAPVRDRGYFVFHDAYAYLERDFGLRPAGSISVTPGHKPGARRVAAIRQRIVDGGVACVFSEVQFEPALVTSLVRGTPARAATLDPLGAGIAPGPGGYAATMRQLAASLANCLSGGN